MADYFSKVLSGTTRPVATTLSAQKLSGATSATVQATTGWDTGTKVHGIMYRTDAGTGEKVAGSQIDWKGSISGTTISDFEVTAGTDDTYAIGTTVELSPTAAWGDDMATGILVEHNQDGTHDEALITGRTEDTSPAGGDFLLTSDVSASNALKKVTRTNLLAGAIGNAEVITGAPVQVVSTAFAAVATGTTTTPLDDTIPQNTEGTEFMTQAITPKSATNILVIEAVIYGANSAADLHNIAALFQDATADAIAAVSVQSTANNAKVITLTHRMVAGTTSATTFKVRVGGSSAGTFTFNGRAGGRNFGAITKSCITITEYKA